MSRDHGRNKFAQNANWRLQSKADHCARNLFFTYLEVILHLATEVVPDTEKMTPPPPKLVSRN